MNQVPIRRTRRIEFVSMYSKLTLQRRKICCQLLAKAVEIILDIKYQKLGTADIQLDNVFFKLDTDRDVCYKRDHNVVNKNGPSFCLQTVSPYIYTHMYFCVHLMHLHIKHVERYYKQFKLMLMLVVVVVGCLAGWG